MESISECDYGTKFEGTNNEHTLEQTNEQCIIGLPTNQRIEEIDREISLKLSDEQFIEIKYKKLVKILGMNSHQEDGVLLELEEHCPLSVAKFIELFATLLGVHTSALLAAEWLMRGLKRAFNTTN